MTKDEASEKEKGENMKKRNLALLLTAVLLSMGGCAAGGETTEQNQQTVQASVEAGEERTETGTKTASSGEASMEALEQHEETPAEDFIYSVLETGIYISGYQGDDSLVVIPEEIDGTPVTLVGGLSNAGIEGIKFSDTVETIGASCFFHDETLQYVICGENVKTIEEIAFEWCVNLKEIRLNEGLETIESGGLSTLSDQLADLYIPESVVKIAGGSLPMNGETLIHVKAGSYAEQYCKDSQKGFPEIAYIVE